MVEAVAAQLLAEMVDLEIFLLEQQELKHRLVDHLQLLLVIVQFFRVFMEGAELVLLLVVVVGGTGLTILSWGIFVLFTPEFRHSKSLKGLLSL